MRFLALIPIVFCATSLVLAFLCLFAGRQKGFMEDYAVLTLNTSQIGQNIFDNAASSSNEVTSLLGNVGDDIQSAVEDAITSGAKALGLHDWYSLHQTDYCKGYYTPRSVPNDTLSRSHIHKNVTSCSNGTGMNEFDPRQILQRELDEAGHGDLDVVRDLLWPEDIDNGIRALRLSARVAFVLYCTAIGLIGMALISAVTSIFLSGRFSAFFNVVLDLLAFVAIGLASAITTAISVKGTDVVNEYGRQIGISAMQGNKFILLTWIATVLVLLASLVWCLECVFGRRRRPREPKGGAMS